MQRILYTLVAIGLLGAPEVCAESSFSEADRSHWSFVPREAIAVPRLDDPALQDRVRTPVDAFVFRRLAEHGLSPAGDASDEQLIRRLTFDLTGLPPSPEEVAAFRKSQSLDRTGELVDRLLNSPRYGEQWGQHWLDLVRFAESEGFEYDRTVQGLWRFRDYVVAAFNADKPFDQFIVEQLAGDEIASRPEAWTAAGFHRLGPVRRNAGNADVAFSRNEILTERTNIIGAAFLGVTVGCARCHDHMFDPIPQRDYYSLQTFFAATYEHDIPLASPADVDEHRRATQRVKEKMDRIKEELKQELSTEQVSELSQQLAQLEPQLPAPLPVIATVKNNADERTPIFLLERGDPEHRRDSVDPQFLGVLLSDTAQPLSTDLAEPKLKLANWIAAPANPLTARVIANRIWHHHFGRGLVTTANDFGVNGEAPSHPELLDYLANYLVDHDWSIKSLQRLILLSSTYRQSSAAPRMNSADQLDPDVELLWRFQRRRLAAHEIRDAMLSAAGLINLQMAGPSVMVPVPEDLVELLYKRSQWQVAANKSAHYRRSVYLTAKRNLRLPFMQVFDQPNMQISCPQRESSTHAPQALELLNGEFSNELSVALANRLRGDVGSKPWDQIRRGYELALGREPSTKELQLSLTFLEQHPLSEFALALFNLNAFIYVD